jgi:hypothetical protein
MATDNPTPPEGAKSVVEQSDDSENFELSPGEEIIGRLVTHRQVETEYGESAILTLETEDGNVVDYFAKDEVKRAAKQGNLERGATYWIAKMAETREVNGNEYYPTKLKQID